MPPRTPVRQAGTSQLLDSLGDRMMFRLAYRNFGDHESLVANHTVGNASQVSVRWYEIRDPNGTPVVYQQGTYAPNASYRWMGSIAMDQVGNIAMAYSVSDSMSKPSIQFTGRQNTDPLGTMESEALIFAGPGAQTAFLNRWGDYSDVTVDPVDGCTFWYTSEYIPFDGQLTGRRALPALRSPTARRHRNAGPTSHPGFGTCLGWVPWKLGWCRGPGLHHAYHGV
jgi:hypothetical protein